MLLEEVQVPINNEIDVVAARQQGRQLGLKLGFSGSELTLIATAISEIARNIVSYAGRGVMTISIVDVMNRPGIQIIAQDEGPGIQDLSLALQDGYSTSKSLGLGLPGTRRLMDEFEIESEEGKGTTIRMIKWTRRK
ncbi:MAG: anti-sigma regulatory factor [Candidatus Obscuribacterales bacterium]|nr:anti-sigma regulatory factor [Candidatus Obscuribacterales bacterium]